MSNLHKYNKALKGEFKEDFEFVQGSVNDFDPCGLIYSGAPIDEYDCLTYQILSAHYNGKTKNEIKELILYEIKYHFGTPDLEISDEPYRANFYSEIETLIDKIEQNITKKHSY